MKKIKGFIAIVLCITLLTSVFTACSSFNLDASDKYISKHDWLNMLGKTFGYVDESYLKEASVDNSTIDYVDACKKWDVIPEDAKISDDEKANREYALSTAVFALGNKVTGLDRTKTSDKKAAEFAVTQNIGKSKSWTYMHEGLTEEDAISILYETTRVYTERDFETYDNSHYKKDLKRQQDTSDYRIDSIENEVVVDSDVNQYSVGDIVVFGEGAKSKALKIVGKEESGNKTILSTKQAELSEICDSLDMSGYGTVENASDITTAAGVELVSFNGEKQLNAFESPDIETLGRSNGVSAIDVGKHTSNHDYKASDLEFSLSLSSGKISASVEKGPFKGEASNKFYKKDADGKEILDDKGKPIPADQIDKWSSENNKYNGGYKITGSLKIDDLLVAASLKYNTVDVFSWDTGALNLIDPADSFEVDIDSKITQSLTVEGYLKEDITIADIPIPVGPLSIDVKVKLCASLNGQIKVKLVFYNSTSITWDGNNGLKRVSHTDTEKDFAIEVKLEISVKIEIGVGVFGLSLIDVDLSIGVSLKLKFEVNDLVLADEGLFKHGGDEQYLTNAKNVYLLCFDATLTLPIIKIGVNTGDSLLAKVDKALENVELSAEWEIVGGEDALVKGSSPSLHYELNSGFVDSCLKNSLEQYKKEDDEEVTDNESKSEDDENTSFNTGLQIDTYAINVDVGETGTVEIIALPKDCSVNDITLETADSSIATVSGVNSINGKNCITITGNAEGTTSFTVSCKNTDESISCVVIVTEK